MLTILYLATLSKDDVLHLGGFSGTNHAIGKNYSYLMIKDEVEFSLAYDIQAPPSSSPSVSSSVSSSVSPSSSSSSSSSASFQLNPPSPLEFQVVLLSEDQFELYVNGQAFTPVMSGSVPRTTRAILHATFIENNDEDEYVLVIQPCFLSKRGQLDRNMNYCSLTQLPSPLLGGDKIFHKFEGRREDVALTLSFYKIDPVPVSCQASRGYGWLLLFLPYLLVVLFGLRVFSMMFRCESYPTIVEQQYRQEMKVSIWRIHSFIHS